MSAGRVLKPKRTFWKAWKGGIERRTPGKIKYQTHMDTYRKGRTSYKPQLENNKYILYQTSRSTYTTCTGESWEHHLLSRKNRQENYHFFSNLSAHKNSRYKNVKVINKHFIQKSLAYFYPCRFQQSVSKTSPLLCPISLPNRIAPSGSRESSQATLIASFH